MESIHHHVDVVGERPMKTPGKDCQNMSLSDCTGAACNDNLLTVTLRTALSTGSA